MSRVGGGGRGVTEGDCETSLPQSPAFVFGDGDGPQASLVQSPTGHLIPRN